MKFKTLINIFFFLTYMFNSFGSDIHRESPGQKKMIVSTIDVGNPALLAIEEIMTLVYSKIGLQLVVVRLPSRRSLPDANNGMYDGELYRVKNITSEYPNLRRVPTPIGTIDFFAYGKMESKLKIIDWNSLKNLKLGAMLGIKHIEYQTKGMDIIFVVKPEQLLQMLYLGRIDVIVMDKNTMFEAKKQAKTTGKEYLTKNVLELKKLDSQELYHYLHVKNESLIPKINLEIQNLTKDGTINKIWKKSKL